MASSSKALDLVSTQMDRLCCLAEGTHEGTHADLLQPLAAVRPRYSDLELIVEAALLLLKCVGRRWCSWIVDEHARTDAVWWGLAAKSIKWTPDWALSPRLGT